jgi:hypothetical protein
LRCPRCWSAGSPIVHHGRLSGPGAQFGAGSRTATLLLVGTLASYYCAYALGLLRWQARVRRDQPPPATEPQRS